MTNLSSTKEGSAYNQIRTLLMEMNPLSANSIYVKIRELTYIDV